ncbi:hypothetical protein K443DRAFT_611757 [Laccaria amethystina LaAM-08-1]|uniref:Secreted protein n=1 Tax=Laccaria amethystina LaAM-08-1 TaxID=1095629 RepID=A0A0C9XRU2_9AGAR|nr:hypothetical protein K443DRAFT_611757 [Laccaria amethystina LaAM-08-1]
MALGFWEFWSKLSVSFLLLSSISRGPLSMLTSLGAVLELSYTGSNNSTIPSSETCPEVILGNKCARCLKLVEISTLPRPKASLPHRAEQLPDA